MRGRWITTLALVTGLTLAASSMYAQDDKGTMGGADQEAMMKEWHKWADPSDMHKKLEKLAGNWTATMRFFMDPSAPAMESQGSCASSFVLGGRWLRQEFKGEMMGMPFEGIGMVGYDNFRKEYVCAWTDNMTTSMLQMRGSCNEAGTEFNFSGIMDEPMTGERDKKFRHVWKFSGADSYTMEAYDNIPGKGEVKVMELTFSRVK